MNNTSRAYLRNDIIILLCVINIKQVQSLTEYTLEYIYYGTMKKLTVGVFRAFMRFSPALENSRDDSRHISRHGRTLGVGSTINVSPGSLPCSHWWQTPKGKPAYAQ